MSNNVQEVFGKFAVQIDGSVVMFDTQSEAETAAVLAEQSEEMQARADAYCAARNLEGKNAKGKCNVILDFLAFEATASDDEETDEES